MKSPKKNRYIYGEPITEDEFLKSTRRLPQYDECLKEFLASSQPIWRVNLDALPSNDPSVVLSSLKWRIKKKHEFKNIRIFLRKGKIYLERESC
jgi:hypothetical protein